ncbi:MAG: hypothetical protein R6W90_10820 [Ignavibacteriaceae bacterium]
MKKHIFIAAVLVILSSNFSVSQDKGFGAGIIIGEPTGISAKYWLNSVNAFDYALGSSFVGNGRIHLHVDYLWHAYDVINSTEIFALYYGPGVRVRTREYGRSNLGIRGVMGLAWFLQTAPMDVFVEIVPVLNLSPDVDMAINASVGARYYFE